MVEGGAVGGASQRLSAVDAPVPYGYATSASFEGASLRLRPTDQPIPEPVTTSLVGLGLGALALQTSRRRRA